MNIQSGRKKNKTSLIISIIIIILLAVLMPFLYRFIINNEMFFETETIEMVQTNVDTETPKPTESDISDWVVPASHPRYISIDAIGMGLTRVENLGTKAGTENQFDDPHNVWNVGWWNKSALPGTQGVGLYDCHTFFVSNYGLCDNLGKLQNGARIVVERGDGEKFYYAVVENKTMTAEEANAYMATLLDLPTGANQAISIITCSGDFDFKTQTASHRTTVRAVLE